MNNSKKLLLLIAIVIIIMVMIVISLLLLNLNHRDEVGENNMEEEEITEIELEGWNVVDDPSTFNTLTNCVQNYLDASNTKLETRTNSSLEEKKEVIYHLLNSTYKTKNKINLNNIQNYMYQEEYYLTFYPLKMNQLIENNLNIYTLYGMLEDNETGNYIEDVYYIIRQDEKNQTFDIEPITKETVKDFNNLRVNTDIEEILPNNDNKYIISSMNIVNLLNRYLSNYQRMAIKYPDRAYEYLEKEYREKRFGSLAAFKQYINENQEQIQSIILDKYQFTSTEDYKQYTCIDTNGNYYIFREKGVMQYQLLLDTYTIDIPEFVIKYEESNPQEKVILNLNRFRQALNDKNYTYAYSLLADSFKKQNFETQAKFEEYVKANFFEQNEFSYEKFGNEANTYYTYQIKITDEKNPSNGAKIKTFIILLEEGTKFQLSFNK